MFDLEILACFCDEAQDLLSKWEQVCLKLEKNPDPDDFNELFRVAHNLKGSSRAVGLESFGNFIHHVEDGITLLKTGETKLNSRIIAELYAVQALMVEWIETAKVDPTKQFDTASVLEKYDAALKSKDEIGSLFVDQKTPELEHPAPVAFESPKGESVPSVEQDHEEKIEPRSKVKAKAKTEANPDETLRVSSKKLDQLLEMVGELSIHQSVIWHTREVQEGRSALLSRAAYLSRKLTRDLYERALSLRMIPVQPTFQRLERNIRDIARQIGKEVEVELVGGEVELDKTVAEKIIEPLTHMVRNSVDHGIEGPEVRLKKGKAATGKVRIEAHQDTGSVVLWIEDDGKGLDQEKIQKKALERGLIRPDTKLSESEIFALIFLPGFSTAEKVTDVSGRGVGMDVVMRTIESLQGQIAIESRLDQGTRFQITLPTSLSIIDALIIRMNDLEYAVPVGQVDEILNLQVLGVSSDAQMLRLREHVIPIQNLRDFLSLKGTESDLHSALVFRVGKTRVAFRVDAILGQQQIVVRNLSEGLEDAFGISGGTILGNGQPGLIVDLDQIAKSYLKQHQRSEEKAA